MPVNELKSNLLRVGDLINIEGPMLVLFQNRSTKELYLFDWVDGNDISNRWLIYTISKENLLNFIRHNISYKELFETNRGDFYFTDIINSDLPNYSIFMLHDVPASYKPDKDVLFDVDDSKNLDKIISLLNPDVEKLTDDKLNSLDFVTKVSLHTVKVFGQISKCGFFSFPKDCTSNTIKKTIPHYKFAFQDDAYEHNRLSKK